MAPRCVGRAGPISCVLPHRGELVRTLTLDLPPDVSDDEARQLPAIRLYEERRVSLGKAADLAGYTVAAFLEILAHEGVTTVDHPAEDLADATLR